MRSFDHRTYAALCRATAVFPWMAGVLAMALTCATLTMRGEAADRIASRSRAVALDTDGVTPASLTDPPLSIDVTPQEIRSSGAASFDFTKPEALSVPIHRGSASRESEWAATGFLWTAPNFYHRPLYFEQPNLERYGQFKHNWQVASALSTAHFFGSVIVLPYKLGKDLPCDRIYTLGYGRPGDLNCRQGIVPDFRLRGGLWEASSVLGLVFLIP